VRVILSEVCISLGICALVSLEVENFADLVPDLVALDFDLMAGLRVDLHDLLDALPDLKDLLGHHIHLPIQPLIPQLLFP
jgi:hypothetical protein